MNKFEKQIEKFNELKKNEKDVYLKFVTQNDKIEFSIINEYELIILSIK